MPKQPKIWFVVVDGGRGRFLCCSRLQHGRIHVDEEASIENHSEEHEHGRPSPRTGKSGNTYASGGHEDEYQLHRFAKEVVGWLERNVKQHQVDEIALFSAPRFLGELRGLYTPNLAGRIREHQADLTHLSPSALARHPAVTELLA